MAIREFTDPSGLRCRVWSTIPLAPTVYDEELRSGWLTFESATARKRLAPIPPDWEDASAERLDEMCRQAETARPTGLTPDPDSSSAGVDREDRRSGES